MRRYFWVSGIPRQGDGGSALMRHLTGWPKPSPKAVRCRVQYVLSLRAPV